jgi:hypothetical protein
MLITLLVYRMEDEACLHPVKYLQEQIQTPQTEDTKLSFGYPIFICWLFIVFTVALYLQANKTGSTLFNTLTEKEKSEIISIPMDYRFMKNDEKLALIERISQHPDIKDKMLTDINYLKGISGTSMQTEKDNRESSLEVNIMNVPNNFFEFMNIPILSGHVLKTNSDMVADRKLVERIKKDLLGTTLYNYQDSYTVCGICSDFVADTYNQSQGFVFLPCDFKYYVGHCYLKCVPGKAEEVEAFVKKMLEENLPPSIQLHISTLQEDIHQAQAIENNMKGINLILLICQPYNHFIRRLFGNHIGYGTQTKGSSYPEGKWSRIETDYFIVCPPLYKTADCFRNYCISINLYSHTNMEKSIYCIL